MQVDDGAGRGNPVTRVSDMIGRRCEGWIPCGEWLSRGSSRSSKPRRPRGIKDLAADGRARAIYQALPLAARSWVNVGIGQGWVDVVVVDNPGDKMMATTTFFYI